MHSGMKVNKMFLIYKQSSDFSYLLKFTDFETEIN